MGRSHHRGRIPSARTLPRAKLVRPVQTARLVATPRLRIADRKSLLLGTALASTLLLGNLLAPTPARALTDCLTGNPPPGPITVNVGDDIICVNVDDRANVGTAVIRLQANGGNHFIDLYNSGALTNVNPAGYANGLAAATSGGNNSIVVVNTGPILVDAQTYAFGITVAAAGGFTPVSVQNSGDLTANSVTSFATGFEASTSGGFSPLSIVNSGDFEVTAASTAFGIDGQTSNGYSPLQIENSGDFIVLSTGSVAFGIEAQTLNGFSPLSIVNSGDFEVTAASTAFGIDAQTTNGYSPLQIENSGDFIVLSTGSVAFGIEAQTFNGFSPLDIINSGDFAVTGASTVFGIEGQTFNGYSPLRIENSGDFIVLSTGSVAFGIQAQTFNGFSPLDIINSGDFAVTGASTAFGIQGQTSNGYSPLRIENSGDFIVLSTGSVAFGIEAQTFNGFSPLDIINSGDFTVTGASTVFGILGETFNGYAPIDIVNSGDFVVTSTGSTARGIRAHTDGADSPIDIVNSGGIWAAGDFARGIDAEAEGVRSGVSVINHGDLWVTSQFFSVGIHARTNGATDSPVSVFNSSSITAIGSMPNGYAWGIFGETRGDNSPLDIENTGDVTASGRSVDNQSGALIGDSFGANSSVIIVNHGSATGLWQAHGIFGRVVDATSQLTIINTGSVVTEGTGAAILATADSLAGSPIMIDNSGSVFGEPVGIRTYNRGVTTIVNSGDLSAASLLAVDAQGTGPTHIYNSGVITGYVLLDADDLMVNQPGGTFEARLTSDFGGPGDSDLFRNEEGGTVRALEVNGVQPSFVNLERFENSGLISMVDGDVDDVFTISNTVGGTDLDFVAGSGAMAVDAFLGPPGSTADNSVIDGDVFGQTQLIVNNTRPGGGVYNPDGIPVVFVPNGQVSSNAFFMPQPFDSGLFDWDVYFVPTGGGSGFFELRSFPGGGAHQLPQLLTAAQDVWHSTSETWFDRTADLRVLLNGGAAYGASGGKLGAAPGASLTPGLWLKGSGSWLEQNDSATTSAQGRTYRYNLDRDLDLWNLQGGVDFGKKGMWAEGDALLFGLLGGAVLGSLDYDQLVRQFDIEGGEVGGYVTYLNGGLFVDTLVKVDFLEFDANGAPGLPGSLDSTAWGARTDTGYRFGGFRGGLFVEPLATLAVVWSDIDDFSFAGNSVKFDDEANVRGRLGLRVGTSREVWQDIVMEPFVIGSLWSNLSGDNKATVTSLGTTFGPFTDEPDDLWGVMSAGVNFFSPGTQTSLFGKIDVAFGDETEGVSAKGGMRYNW